MKQYFRRTGPYVTTLLDHFISLCKEKMDIVVFKLFCPQAGLALTFPFPASRQAGMKSKQKSCQNKPSAGRFDGPRTRFE